VILFTVIRPLDHESLSAGSGGGPLCDGGELTLTIVGRAGDGV
jgi:hypothetical protein